ncbi:flavocytochrome c [uncultured Anaerococcus sp.]|mgnify:CR=1 FL=1|uniref:flavocytochrome c n=1 Tax=uncultured Anaerococcus sp. TaxID=293428 RepID=UPI0025E3D812|nr:flavocytochrome c [uncultured Anaerococcus sp.]
MTKKTLSYLMAVGLSVTMLASCANDGATDDASDNEAVKEESAETVDQNTGNEKDSADQEDLKDEKVETEESDSNEAVNTGDKDPETTGTYEATAPGYGGDIKVSVDLGDDGKINDIEILEDNETIGVGKVALDTVKSRIVSGQSTNVEAVTGATASSKGLMLATSKALEEAGIADDYKEEYKEKREYPSEIDTNIVIVGGGGAGLTAAVEATQAGSSVVVVEKNGFVGGNTILSGGIYNAPDPELQEPEGIEDSEELFYEQTYEAGDEVANPELVKVLTSQADDGLEWLKSLGMEFGDKIGQGAGSLHPRTHFSVKPNGTGFIDAFMENLDESGNAQILTETTAEHIIMKDGKSAGIKAKNYDGSDLTINAKQGVIVTTGGFAKNPEMVVEYKNAEKWPNLDEKTISTNLDSITGDGITMGEEVGADLVDMDQMQFLYLGIPGKGQITGLLKSGAENDIIINKEGKRFVREDGRRDVISKAIFEQPDQIMYMIHSSDYFDYDKDAVTLENESMKEILETGKYGWVKADTLEELAKKLEVPYENLQQTVDHYNQLVEEGATEDEFGRELFTNKIEKGPWVAVPRTPALHHTMGGLKIDTGAHVLDKNGNQIPGLFAAGEVTGGIHGANRVGGNAVVDLVVFGRIAGQNASEEAK